MQYGVFTARAKVAFGIPANGLPADFPGDVLAEAHIRGEKSLAILDEHLDGREWLTLGRPTIADIAVFPYIALAPMGDIALTPYANVQAWIARHAPERDAAWLRDARDLKLRYLDYDWSLNDHEEAERDD